MSRKKPAPAVASTGCSGLMSCRSIHPRGPPPAPRRDDDDADGGDAEQYRKRLQFLEEEIRRLSKRLGQEERPAPPAAECVKTKEEGGGAATTTATKKFISAGHGDGGVKEMERLEDGSYLHEVRRSGRPWERLAVQVPRPVVVEDASSASEALDKMTAMRPEDLRKFLTQMMPLKDIAGRRNAGEPVRRTARLSNFPQPRNGGGGGGDGCRCSSVWDPDRVFGG